MRNGKYRCHMAAKPWTEAIPSNWTSRWSVRRRFSRGSTMLGLACPTMGCRKPAQTMSASVHFIHSPTKAYFVCPGLHGERRNCFLLRQNLYRCTAQTQGLMQGLNLKYIYLLCAPKGQFWWKLLYFRWSSCKVRSMFYSVFAFWV